MVCSLTNEEVNFLYESVAKIFSIYSWYQQVHTNLKKNIIQVNLFEIFVVFFFSFKKQIALNNCSLQENKLIINIQFNLN